MEHTIIKINKTELAELLVGAKHGTTDRDICYNTETGEIQNRHNTLQRGPWVVLVDLYSTDYDGVQEWTVTDWKELLTDTGIEPVEIQSLTGDCYKLFVELQ